MQCAHAAESKTAHLHDETRVPTSIIAAIKSDSLSKSVTCITSLKGAPPNIHQPLDNIIVHTFAAWKHKREQTDFVCSSFVAAYG